MNISSELQKELRIIFAEEFGKKLDDAETKETAEYLVSYFDLLLKIKSENDNENAKPAQIIR